MKLINLTRGWEAPLEVADTFLKRLVGLMFVKEYDGALLFPGGGSFHTFFCRFPILFLCLEGGRVKEARVVPPWRTLTLPCESVVELDARKYYAEVGDEVRVE